MDWWRVEQYQPDKLLRLAAEMKLPGRAWLEFEVTSADAGSTIRQTAIFDPVGLGGRLYRYSLYPLHAIIFRGMLHRIAWLAEHETGAVPIENDFNQKQALSGTRDG